MFFSTVNHVTRYYPPIGLHLIARPEIRHDAAGRLAPDEAARGYARALELDPTPGWTRAYLGMARLRQGRVAEAIRSQG